MQDFSIERLVPRFILNDRTGHAMAKAIGAGLKYLCDRVDDGVAAICDVDRMPEWRLDEYAWELGAEWYDSTTGVEDKRKQIKYAFSVYRKLGTKAGVLDAVEGVFGEGMIQEWFQYDGAPYHFKVYVTDESAVYDRRGEFMRVLGYVQNIRSVLDSIEVRGMNSETTAYYAAAVSSISARSSAVAS